jgi:hypothetical protein
MGEEMFKDLALSKESMRDYHSKLDEDSPGKKLNAMVLQRSAWPFTVQKHGIDLPPNVRRIPHSSWVSWGVAHQLRYLDASRADQVW